ncbi:MAG: xanthine dehydrogenase family protein molybdopterin-binding subunit, partial [Acetobacteraceae bacterium]|nr:xanthine dehydrogenase family protein molybdopterin-binding subunit [Acetobacteraceae bacterium]
GSLKQTPFLDSWIRIDSAGKVTVFTGKAELGQGLGTALLQLAAEQLDIDPGEITLITADTGRTPNEGVTAGSHSMQDSGTAIVNAAFQVRRLLMQEAASQLGLPAERLRPKDGAVWAPDGRRLGYGPLAAALSLHVPAEPSDGLRAQSTRRWIGSDVPRIDIPAKLTGGAAYVQDMRPSGMLHARIVRQPSAGAILNSVDTAAIEAMPGVVKVIHDGSFLAVVAAREWQAIKAWRALSDACAWEESAALPDQATIFDTLQALPVHDNVVLQRANPADAPIRELKARYTRPYQMHGSIGPSCALAQFENDRMTVWTHTQGVFPLRAALAELLRLPAAQIRCVHVEGSGCYGHNGADDVAADAALIARALPGRPIRVQWMREQENTAEPFGPAMIGDASAGLDANGRVVKYDYAVWSNTHNRRPTAGGLLLANAAMPEPLPMPPPAPIPMPEGGGSRNSNPLYTFANANVVERFIPHEPLRVSALRGLGAYLNIFALESFMDELAREAGADPVQFRLAHLSDERAKAVIAKAAENARWSAAIRAKPGFGQGFAFARYKNLGAYCAVALALHVEHATGRIRLGPVVAAVDSGTAVNPDGIRNQIEGGIVQSASWTLYEQVAYDHRHITSRDWNGYPILRFPAAPESVDVHVIDRPGEPFLGTGEAAQGPTSAAIANAVFNATGVRLRDLPFQAAKVKAAIGV